MASDFNKETAFDELGQLLENAPKDTMSGALKMIQSGQDYLQKIYDQAFEAGFEKGCDAAKKVEDL